MDEQGEKGGKLPSSKSPTVEDDSRTFTERVLDSASSLLHDSISPNSAQAAATLTNVLASEGKAGPSTASAATGPRAAGNLQGSLNIGHSLESMPYREKSFREASLVNGNTRSRYGSTAGEMSLDQFMQSAQYEGEVPGWQHSPTTKGKQPASRLNLYHVEDEASEATMSAAWESVAASKASQPVVGEKYNERYATNGLNGAARINEADGAEVVKILQDPISSIWTEMPKEEEEIPYTIFEEDMGIAEDLVRRLEKAIASNQGYESAISAVKRGEPFPSYSSFFDDIENYQDEVWGFLRPLVEKARKECDVPGPSGPEEGPATRRLRMILAHIDGQR
jgi:hypothetical protein